MRDLESETLWSHLLGRGMEGELEGSELEMLPAAMTSWGEWKDRHPETTILAMTRTVRRYNESAWRQPKQFVFGIPLGADEPAPAVSLARLQEDGVVEVKVGEHRLVVSHVAEGGSIQAFAASHDSMTLTFESLGETEMKDRETGTRWNRISGEAVSGPLAGAQLREFPGTISFREPWEEFYPDDLVVD